MCWIPRCFFWCRWKYMLILCIWNNFVFIINKLINICQVIYALCKYMCNQWINLNQIDVSDYFCYCIFIHHYNITLKLISILYVLVLQKYQEHNSNDASVLEAVIELLHHTSELLSLFNDKLFITSPDDARLNKLNSFYNWMCHWANESQGHNSHFLVQLAVYVPWFPVSGSL